MTKKTPTAPEIIAAYNQGIAIGVERAARFLELRAKGLRAAANYTDRNTPGMNQHGELNKRHRADMLDSAAKIIRAENNLLGDGSMPQDKPDIELTFVATVPYARYEELVSEASPVRERVAPAKRKVRR